MYLIKVDHSLNQQYVVSKDAIDGAVELAIKDDRNFDMVSFDTKEVNNNIVATIVVNKKTNKEFIKALNVLVDEVSLRIKLLINKKPSNIEVKVENYGK